MQDRRGTPNLRIVDARVAPRRLRLVLISVALACGACASRLAAPAPPTAAEAVVLPVRAAPVTTAAPKVAASDADRSRSAAHRQMREVSRLNSIGMPLAIIAAPLCRDTSFPTIGTLPASLLDAPETRRAALKETFGLEARPTLMFIVATLPAAEAGLRPGDVLETIDGQPIGYGTEGRTRLRKAVDLAAVRGTTVVAQVLRDKALVPVRIRPVASCARALLVGETDTTPVRWDDGTLWISRPLLESLDDRQLATVLAHALLTARRSTAGSKVRSASDIDGQALAILKAAGYPLQPIGPTWRRLAEMDLKWASPEAYPLTPTRIRKLEGEAEGATRGPPTAQASGRAVRLAVPSVPGPWIVMWRDEGFQGSVD